MTKDIEVLSKGLYRHSQIKDFIYVKYYMFIRKANKKYLTLKFENGSDTDFKGMSFTVVMLDSNGGVIERISIECPNAVIKQRGTYEYGKMIRVKPDCSDFTVVFDAVYAGDVMYTEQSGRAVARYASKNAAYIEALSPLASAPRKVKKHRFLMKLVALITLGIILVSNTVYIFKSISDENDRRREVYERRLEDNSELMNKYA